MFLHYLKFDNLKLYYYITVKVKMHILNNKNIINNKVSTRNKNGEINKNYIRDLKEFSEIRKNEKMSRLAKYGFSNIEIVGECNECIEKSTEYTINNRNNIVLEYENIRNIINIIGNK